MTHLAIAYVNIVRLSLHWLVLSCRYQNIFNTLHSAIYAFLPSSTSIVHFFPFHFIRTWKLNAGPSYMMPHYRENLWCILCRHKSICSSTIYHPNSHTLLSPHLSQ